MRRSIKSAQRQTRLIALKLDGTGAAALGGPDALQASLVDNGTGDYSITLDESYSQVPVVVATSITADVIVQIDALAVGGFDILCFDATDGTTAKDADVEIICIGQDTLDDY